ncbi:MAG TPA: sigma-70 family RNA polymerase sigma factor [Thermomicrobiales bacterium]|nr:sigma-70 family RNA polymerase sigma factor [Thermomicrobiales bacterium]
MVGQQVRGDEALLIARAGEGDQAAFQELVERYQGAVYNLAYRMLGAPEEAEDAAQEIFVRIYRQLARYDRSRKFSTWVLAIATNYCIDQLRRRRLQLVPLENIIPWARAREAGPEREALDREASDELQTLLRRLPEKYRAVLILRYWEELSCAEIGEVLQVPEGTVKTQLHRARKALERLMTEQGEPRDALSRV